MVLTVLYIWLAPVRTRALVANYFYFVAGLLLW